MRYEETRSRRSDSRTVSCLSAGRSEAVLAESYAGAFSAHLFVLQGRVLRTDEDVKPCPKNPDGKPWHLRVDGRQCGNCGAYFPTIGLSAEIVAEPDAQNRGAMLHAENVELLDLLERVLYRVDVGDRVTQEMREECAKWLRIR